MFVTVALSKYYGAATRLCLIVIRMAVYLSVHQILEDKVYEVLVYSLGHIEVQ